MEVDDIDKLFGELKGSFDTSRTDRWTQTKVPGKIGSLVHCGRKNQKETFRMETIIHSRCRAIIMYHRIQFT